MGRIAIITTRRAAHAALACVALLLCACEITTAPEPSIEEIEPKEVVLEAGTPVSLAGAVADDVTPTPVVRLWYDDGTVARGVAVTFTVSGGGTVASDSAVTDSNGHASPGAWRLGPKAGTQTLTARAGNSSLTFTAHARAGPAAVLEAVAGDGQSASAGAALPQPLRVRARDRFANPVPGVAVRFVVIEGGGAIAADTAFTDVNGYSTSGLWMLGPVAGRQQVRAQSGDMNVLFSAEACDPALCIRLVYVRDLDLVAHDEHTGLFHVLTYSDRDDHPAWSPDGTRIAFARYSTQWDSAHVWVMNANGTGQIRVTSGSVAHSPTWSPDGDALAFAGNSWPCVYECAIYVQELAEGSVPRVVAPMGADPAWSPDGSRIAFVALSGDDGYHSLRLVRPDGSGIVEVTPIDEGSINGPAWSPDGTLIAFSKCMQGVCDIHTVRPDGSDLKRVTNSSYASSPAWSADGTRIAYTSWSSDGPSIAWLPAAGGMATPLIKSGHSPAWRP